MLSIKENQYVEASRACGATDKRIIMRWWTVRRSEIPQDRDDRIEWLFGWWEHIDAWISDHAPVDVPRRTVRRPTSAT